MLLLAYERRPGGRTICYSLCELSIKMEEYVQAIEYYKEFVQVAPKDPGRYILQYKLYEAQDVSLEERIAVLEELKKRDYREKWAYELAYLYHRVGLAARCVEDGTENAPSAVDTGAAGKIRSSVRRARKPYPVAELCAG